MALRSWDWVLKKADFHTQKPSTRALQVKGIAEVKTLLQGIIPEKKKTWRCHHRPFLKLNVVGWTMIPKICLHPHSQNLWIILFVEKEVIKLGIYWGGAYPGLSCSALNVISSFLMRKMQRNGGKGEVKTEEEAEETGKEWILPTASRWSAALLTAWF